MSLLSSFTKKSKLSATIKQTQQARNSEGNTADQLFKSAYSGYAQILLDDPIRAEALYNWGFALLHQAKTKEGAQAESLYQDAINKFAFCMLINPDYLGAAINGGVAYMDLARLKNANASDVLYTLAQQQFEIANRIQAGTASYNLACIHALRGDFDDCLKAFENSQARGSLPDANDIVHDPDLDNVKGEEWFIAFITPLLPEAVEVEEQPEAENVAAVVEVAEAVKTEEPVKAEAVVAEPEKPVEAAAVAEPEEPVEAATVAEPEEPVEAAAVAETEEPVEAVAVAEPEEGETKAEELAETVAAGIEATYRKKKKR
ncbi:MAG: hypothetical protein PHU14_06645 [Methylovulum sp.]|nr:hypothetical protein [Methylovulum sp.]